MKTNWFYRLCALVCVLFISGIDATAALNAYFKADDILGDSVMQGYEDYTEVHGYNHEVTAPVDVQTGQATGRRQHRPFKILKRISINSPQFENVLVKNQVIPSAEFKLLRANPNTGRNEAYYIYRFTNVRIVSVRDWAPNNQDLSVAAYPHLQEISFVYQAISWEVPGGPVAEDSWTNQN